MGWFGSLQLAYKYAIVLGSLFALVIIAGIIKVYFSKRRLKKYTKKAEEDASGAGEERVELNKRELDEGDLFGIRAIQSGYFGGVAQSRPSSIAEDRSDRDSTASNTLLGSHQSPERKGPSPMSSVVTLPLEARTSSPLRHTAISAADPDRPRASKRQGPHPIKSTLQPSDAQIKGGVNHDPAVNMSLNVPPSPGATSRRSSGFEFSTQNWREGSGEPYETPERSPESASVPHNSQYGGHYVPTAAPDVPVTSNNRNSARPVSTGQYHEHESYSQHAFIESRDSDVTVRDNNRPLRSSIQEENNFSTRPAQPATRSSIQEEDDFSVMPNSRHVSSYRPLTTRTSSYDYQAPNPSRTSPPRDHGVLAVPHPRNQHPSSDIKRSSTTFHETDQLALDSYDTTRNHISHLSDASSIYSIAQRYSVFPEPPLSPRNHPQPSDPQAGMNRPSQQSYETPTIAPSSTTINHPGTSRVSDASSHQPLSLSTPSANDSHRNTRELGDFYDSYWRHSEQSTIGSGNAAGLKEGARAEGRNREGRRQDRLDIEVPTIPEMETPVGSPALMGGRGVGMAM